MKVSLNLIKYYNAFYNSSRDPYEYGVDEILQRIGAQLGAVEDVEYTGKKYDGIVVAKVIECEPHDNSDHLSVCMIDAGGVYSELATDDSGLIQVVCGALNVRVGLTVAWIPPGAVVPSTLSKDPFELSVREIRGKVSNGMLASPAELGLSDNHDGILEIDINDVGEDLAKPGVAFKNLYELDDVVIDCENKMFTHRPDCFGTLGVAREIAGIFGDAYKSPEWYLNPLEQSQESRVKSQDELQLTVKNDISDLVPRFMMQAVADVNVTESPMWLQSYLSRMGMKTINNIVDYSNYFMMLTAQPTHAFDYDKVIAVCGENPVFAPRLAKKGEKIALLNGKTIELSSQDLVITANNRPIALAGVMGGSETEVDENTKNIVLECATFDMYTIRRTSMRHGLFTDAVKRYTKGQSSLQNDKVLAKIVDEIVTFAGGKVASQIFDLHDESTVKSQESRVVQVSSEFINSRLGSNLSADQIKTLLENVEFSVEIVANHNSMLKTHDSEMLSISSPFWRMDIEIPEDIIEEVGRLYGYDKLPVELPLRVSQPVTRNKRFDFADQLRESLKLAGANELLNYSFVHGDLMRNSGIDPEKWAYHLRNAISPELQYYRTSLIPCLLTKVHPNIKSQAGRDDNQFAIFEIGKVHIKGELDDENLPKQFRHLALVFTAEGNAASNYHGSSYYQAKKYLESVVCGPVSYLELDTNEYPISAPFQQGRAAIVELNGQMLGVVGEFSAKVHNRLKLPEFCAGFELDMDLLRENISEAKYQQLSNFPTSHQDITLEVDERIKWDELRVLIEAELAVAKAELGYWSNLTALDIYQQTESDKKRFSFRISVTHHEKTLKTEEVNALLDQLASEAKEQFDAKRI